MQRQWRNECKAASLYGELVDATTRNCRFSYHSQRVRIGRLATTSSSLGALVIIDDRSSQDGVGPVDSAAGRE